LARRTSHRKTTIGGEGVVGGAAESGGVCGQTPRDGVVSAVAEDGEKK